MREKWSKLKRGRSYYTTMDSAFSPHWLRRSAALIRPKSPCQCRSIRCISASSGGTNEFEKTCSAPGSGNSAMLSVSPLAPTTPSAPLPHAGGGGSCGGGMCRFGAAGTAARQPAAVQPVGQPSAAYIDTPMNDGVSGGLSPEVMTVELEGGGACLPRVHRRQWVRRARQPVACPASTRVNSLGFNLG